MIVELGQGRYLADLRFRGQAGLVASYFLPGPDGWTVVETGPSTCREALLGALGEAGIDRRAVVRVFVTHIHLDHAGGLGALAASLPTARLYAHASGVAHLIDPTRLIESARRAWGPSADPLWGPISPVPADRITPLQGGETFPIAGGTLEVIATPGHARHHLAYFDTALRGLLTGDAVGVRLPTSWRPRPALPPPDLDLGLLFESLDAMARRAPARLFYAHFGEGADGARDLERYRQAVTRWRDVALSEARGGASVERVASALHEADQRDAEAAGASLPAVDPAELISGYSLAAQGLLRYFRTHGLLG
jgi:glyoxylase-like metal-dependent hydrolase (beta-lactamase superfamily II)